MPSFFNKNKAKNFQSGSWRDFLDTVGVAGLCVLSLWLKVVFPQRSSCMALDNPILLSLNTSLKGGVESFPFFPVAERRQSWNLKRRMRCSWAISFPP